MPTLIKKKEFDFNSLPDQQDQGVDFSSLPDQAEQKPDFSSLPDRSESTPSLASRAIDALNLSNLPSLKEVGQSAIDYLKPSPEHERVLRGIAATGAQAAGEVTGPSVFPIPAETGAAFQELARRIAPERMTAVQKFMVGQQDTPETRAKLIDMMAPTEEEILHKAYAEKHIPVFDLAKRLGASIVSQVVPLTPVQVGMTAATFADPIMKIGGVTQDFLLNKNLNLKITPETIGDFYKFGRERLDPQTYEILLKTPKEELIRVLKSGEDLAVKLKVPRFGGGPAPTAPAIEPLKPGIPTETANLPTAPEPKPIFSPKASDFLRENHPAMAKIVDSLPDTIDSELLKKTVVDATTQANIATINGGSPQEAQAAALRHLGERLQSGELAPKIEPEKALKVDTQGIPIRKPNAVVTQVDLGEGQKLPITHSQVLNEAKALQQDALNSREISPLEQFVKRNGGVKGYKGGVEGEEFKGVPVHLRGTQAVDEMAQMAYHRGLLDEPSGDLLREKLKEIKARGPEPKLGDFYDQAVRNLEYYAQEGVQIPIQPENVPRGEFSNLEQAKAAAQDVLRTNKIDNQVIVKIVDQIAVDDQAFKKGYGQAYKPSEFEIQGATYTPGMKDRIKSVIELANGADRGVGRHEAFHAVSNILLDPTEQKIITDRYGDMEKAADAFAEYRNTGQAETPLLERIFQKIKDFLDRIKNYFDSKNFKTAEDLFKDIEEGKLKGGGAAREGPQYKAAEVMDLKDKALEQFGKTKDFEKAGFIFPDGQMVDFTKGGKDRIFMHQDISRVYEGTGEVDDPYSLLQKFMEDTGAVRLSQYDDVGGHRVSIEAHGPMSHDQIKEIGEYFDTHPMDMSTFEVMNSIGRSVRSAGIKEPTSEDVARFFNGSSQYKAVENKPPFFSMVEKTINDKMPTRSSGDQIMGLLRNSPGVKQEELDWIGLPEFLKGKTSITKEEVQNFIKENNVQVQEVMKGQPGVNRAKDFKVKQLPDGRYGIIEPKFGSQVARMFLTKEGAEAELKRLNTYSNEPTKFEKYTLPGGENYRELLLTTPKLPAEKSVHEQGLERTISDVLKRRDAIGDSKNPQWKKLDAQLGDLQDQRLALEKGRERITSKENFTSSHFPEPNILSHVRFNDRVDANGKKTLFIEEIQSDWHQKGRTMGYTEPPRDPQRMADLSKEKTKLEDVIDAGNQGLAKLRGGTKGYSEKKTALHNEINAAADRLVDIDDELKILEGKKGVPNAPFKKTWHELSLKRMLRYAAENGYDQIAWTTGEQQAERYDLSHQVDSIRYRKTGDDLYEMSAVKDGNSVIVERDKTGAQLKDIVGKDVSDKIINGEGKKIAGPGSVTELSGVDLKVGGEGMKGFYDQMIPSFLNRYSKKWGGRVGETEFPGEMLRPQIRVGDQWFAVNGLMNYFESHGIDPKSLKIGQELPEMGKIEDMVRGRDFSYKTHSLDITPAMKESVIHEGQPLYKAIQKDSAMDLKQSANEIRDLVNPSKSAPLAAAITREQLGKMARSFDKAEAALGKAHSFFEGQSVANNIDFIDKMEHGQPQPTPELNQIATQLRDLFDSKRNEIQALGTGKLKNFIENYFPHIWDQGEKQVSKAAQVMSKRPFEGGKSFLKKRTIETFKQGIEAGLTPASYNPIDQTFLKIREMDKYIMAHKTLNEFKEEGLSQFVKIGSKPPEGWVKINDNISTVMRPITNEEGKMEGLAIVGHYYAQPDAARIINNYLSPGLQKSEVYRAYRYLGNAINQFQLGLSAFHLGFTSVDSMVSKFALALNQLALGHPMKAIKAVLQTPFAPVENVLRGDKLLKAWKGQGSTKDEILAEAMATGGGRAKMDQFYATKAYDQMKKYFQAGKYVKGIFQAPFAAIEASSKPILEYIVPRQKLGVFADIMKMELEHNPNMSHEEFRMIKQKAWDSVDNRMGQLVYDNLFWNRTFKDLLMGSVRSVGWNLGTIREILGGIGDFFKFGRGPKGRGANLSYRSAYVIALPVVAGILGAIYQYLRTGKGPQELKDYYFPRTGSLDENGDPVRVSIPSYMKDLYHYTQHPVTTVTNKLSPLIGMVAQMLNNKDYFGTKIRNEDDPLVKQVAGEAQYILKQMIPFGIRNAQKNMQNDKELRDIVEPFIGITPAPYDINQTKAETLAHRISAQKMPIGGRTQEQAEHSKVLRDFSKRLKLNDPNVRAEMFQAIRDRKITPMQVAKINRESNLTPLQRQVLHFSAAEIKKVYDLATPEEKKQIENMMKAKIARSKTLVEQP